MGVSETKSFAGRCLRRAERMASWMNAVSLVLCLRQVRRALVRDGLLM